MRVDIDVTELGAELRAYSGTLNIRYYGTTPDVRRDAIYSLQNDDYIPIGDLYISLPTLIEILEIHNRFIVTRNVHYIIPER